MRSINKGREPANRPCYSWAAEHLPQFKVIEINVDRGQYRYVDKTMNERLTEMKVFRWRSMVTLIAAICVLLSTWLTFGQIERATSLDAGRSIQEMSAWPTVLAAGFLLILALLSLVMRRAWLAALRLLVGIWLLVSPWILPQEFGTIPMITLVTGGTAVVVVAAFDLYRDFRHESDDLSHLS
ncbi:MAG: SPW repeat domain-containing protein [Geminicoccaceae bacterium]